MSASEIRLQPLARSRVQALGEPGAAWLAGLPDLVSDLADRWQLTLGRGLPGGSTGYVAAATRTDGTPAVLKVVCGEDVHDEITVFQLAAGRGYARLLESDAGCRALLLEHLGPQLGASGQEPEDVLQVIANTLVEAWAGLPLEVAAPQLQPQPNKANMLAERIERWWVQLGRPCSRAAVDRASSYAAELADADAGELVIVHGDPHPHNAMRVPEPRSGAESGYVFVDPDGFVCDRAYDLGVVVRDWSAQLTAASAAETIAGYCKILADQTGVDAERIWAWGFLERMSTGLYVATLGASAVAEPFLRTADWLVNRDHLSISRASERP